MKAQSGSRGTALHFSNLGAKWLRGQRHVPAALPAGKQTGYPFVQVAGWGPGLFTHTNQTT